MEGFTADFRVRGRVLQAAVCLPYYSSHQAVVRMICSLKTTLPGGGCPYLSGRSGSGPTCRLLPTTYALVLSYVEQRRRCNDHLSLLLAPLVEISNSFHLQKQASALGQVASSHDRVLRIPPKKLPLNSDNAVRPARGSLRSPGLLCPLPMKFCIHWCLFYGMLLSLNTTHEVFIRRRSRGVGTGPSTQVGCCVRWL